MELDFLNWLQGIRTPGLDYFFKILTTLGDHAEIWLLIILFLFFYKKKKETAVLAVVAIVIELIIVSLILKPIFSRPRPFLVDPIDLLISRPQGSSFPSGHSASSFAVAVLLFREKVKFRVPILIVAFLMAFSRLYVFVHYPSDVVVGSIIGILIGLVVHKNRQYILNKYRKVFNNIEFLKLD
ncbi:MAG TPA: phosphatase PAP2 family protein [Erysipelothrix sp.]